MLLLYSCPNSHFYNFFILFFFFSKKLKIVKIIFSSTKWHLATFWFYVPFLSLYPKKNHSSKVVHSDSFSHGVGAAPRPISALLMQNSGSPRFFLRLPIEQERKKEIFTNFFKIQTKKGVFRENFFSTCSRIWLFFDWRTNPKTADRIELTPAWSSVYDIFRYKR